MKRIGALAAFAFLIAACASAPASAEVAASSAAGMISRNVAEVKASPSEVWAALVQPSRYWSPDHSWSGSSANMTLDPRAGGCFCEALPASGGSVRHAEVIYADPGNQLRLSGAFGPLQSEALTGTLTVRLTAIEGGTRIEWTYVVGGYAGFDLVQLAPAVDGVMGEQLHRLSAVLGGP